MSVVTNFLLLLLVNFTVVPYYIWHSTDSRPRQIALTTQAVQLMLLYTKTLAYRQNMMQPYMKNNAIRHGFCHHLSTPTNSCQKVH